MRDEYYLSNWTNHCQNSKTHIRRRIAREKDRSWDHSESTREAAASCQVVQCNTTKSNYEKPKDNKKQRTSPEMKTRHEVE